MGRQYEQLTESERQVIGRLHAGGRSQREIARTLQRDPSTINRELRRNSRPTKAWPGGYRWRRAQGLTDRRRRRGRHHKLARQPDLRDLVRGFLAMGWSPGQIAGRLALRQGGTVISHESIYRYVYHRTAQKDYWNRLLPRAKHRRGRPGRKGGSPVDFIKQRLSIDLRPAAAETRTTAGHWESDLMAFSKPGQAILLAQERACRYILTPAKTRKRAASVLARLKARFRSLPQHLRATSPSTTAPSSRVITSSPSSASTPSSVIPDRPGRRAASRTPSAGSADTCPEPPISLESPRAACAGSSTATTTPHANASASEHQPRSSRLSNVNPVLHLKRDSTPRLSSG